MHDLLPFVIVGLTSGSLYGLAGVGLVLTFKTTGIFNFAHGGVAAVAAYAFYDLHYGHGLPWPLTVILCVAVLGPVLGLAFSLLGRQLGEVRPVMGIVATVGVLVFIQGFLAWKYSPQTLEFPQYLPQGSVSISGVNVQYSQIVAMAVAVLAAAGLYAFFRLTRPGMAMRGVVDDPTLLALAGTPPARVRAAAWMIGCGFAALSGVLIGPTFGRDPSLLTLLVVQAFGAAAIGAFSSLPLTYLGGLVIGLGASIATKYVAGHDSLSGLPASVPFLILFVALLVTPARRLRVPSTSALRLGGGHAAVPKRVQAATALVVLGVLVALPSFVGPKLPVFISGLTYVIVFLSLGLLVWTSGQISLCHAAFVAIGATTFSHLTHGLGLPWLPALLLAGLAAVPAGAAIAIPAIRLSGVYLALATFGFGLLIQRIVFERAVMFGGEGSRAASRPVLGILDGTSDRGLYYIVLVVVAAAALAIVLVNRSRLGRLLRALGESPTALTTHGLSVNVTRLLVFCISAYLAAIAGALFISAAGAASIDGFGFFNSLQWLAVLAICGTAVVSSSVVAAVVLVIVPAYLPHGFVDYQAMVFGVSAIAASVLVGRRIESIGERTSDRLEHSPVRDRLPAVRDSRVVTP